LGRATKERNGWTRGGGKKVDIRSAQSEVGGGKEGGEGIIWHGEGESIFRRKRGEGERRKKEHNRFLKRKGKEKKTALCA